MSGRCLLKICKDKRHELSSSIGRKQTVLFHFGAYTFIGYNVFELYSEDNRTYGDVASFGHSSRNYNHLPYRAKAQQILYDYLLEIRKTGKLRP